MRWRFWKKTDSEEAEQANPRIKREGWWRRQILRELSSYQGGSANLDELVKSFAEVGQQTRNVFFVHLTVCAYAGVTLLSVKDADFFISSAGIKLPVIDVQARPALFFASIPLLLVLIAGYLHIYLGQMHRIRRRIAALQTAGTGRTDPDILYPWIATLAAQRGSYGWIVRGTYNFLIWWATPAILFAFWARLLVLRGVLASAIRGNGPPPARFVGAVAIIALAGAFIWSGARRSMDTEYGLRLKSSIWGWLTGVVTVLGFAATLASQWKWHRAVCNRGELTSICRVQMNQAILSTPQSGGNPRALGAQLANLKLDGANLEAAFLERANLSGAWLIGANLREAALGHLQAAAVHLEAAILDGADIREADLTLARLEGAQLLRAHLEGAQLATAHLEGANLSGAHLEKAYLRWAHLEGARMDEVHLEGADIREAHFERADLSGAHLEGADLSGTHLEAAALLSAHLEGADLSNTHFEGAALLFARLEGAYLSRAHLEGTHMMDVHLEGASLSSAHLEGADLLFARLQGAFLGDAHLEGAYLAKAHLEGVDFREAHFGPAILPLPHEELPTDVVATLKKCSQKPANFEGAIANAVCGQLVPGMTWKVATEDECSRMRVAVLDSLEKARPEIKELLKGARQRLIE